MSGDDLYDAMHHTDNKIFMTMPKFQQIKEIYFQALHEHCARGCSEISRTTSDAY
jgi:hypothetical protein